MNGSTRLWVPTGSGRLDNSSGTDAAGAGIDMRSAAITGHCPNSLQIGQPTTTGLVMGVADIISGSRAFATNFTITGHDIFS